MIKLIIFTSLIFVSVYSAAQPLSAILTFESTAITTDGVTKKTYFQERFIRDENTIWSERIVPKLGSRKNHNESHDQLHDELTDNMGVERKAEHDHAHNLNFSTAGKWLVRDTNSGIKFRLVRKDDHKIIEPRTTEYGTLGFNGEWETAYYLLNRAQLKNMKVLEKAAPQGAQWYEKVDKQQFTRILWDNTKEIPLSIETANRDGTSNSKITIATATLPNTLPWNNLKTYETIAYEDLLD